MYKRIYSMVIVFVLFIVPFLFFASSSQAQDPTQVLGLHMVCLNATKVRSGHIARLHGGGLMANQPMEIWRKVEAGFQCAIDKDGVSTCLGDSTIVGKNFQILSHSKDQLVADLNGSIVIDEVHSATKGTEVHTFYAVQQIITNEALEAAGVALKLATFAPPTGSQSTCTFVRWDPYGRVFDAISLEPLDQVTVTLLDEAKKQVPNQPGVINPLITAADGSFSFIVEDGTYYLDARHMDYNYPLTATEISQLQAKQNTYTDLYTGEPIIQAGSIQQRDIPLNPKDPSEAKVTAPKIISYDITTYTKGAVVYQMIYGLVSHPNSIVKAYSGVRLIGTTNADNQGEFQLDIENSLVDQNTTIDLQAEKASILKTQDRVQPSFFSFLSNLIVVEAREINNNTSEVIKIEPIPVFLAGLVYDHQGQLAPNTTVQLIVPSMNNRVVATATVDSQGYLFVSPQQIPPTTFSLRVIDASGITVNELSTKQFITTNSQFFDDEKINLYDTDIEKIELMAEAPAALLTSQAQYAKAPTPIGSITEEQESQQTLSSSLNYILLTLIIIVVLGILIFFILKLKAKQT